MAQMQLFHSTNFKTFLYCEIWGFWFSICLHLKFGDAAVQEEIAYIWSKNCVKMPDFIGYLFSKNSELITLSEELSRKLRIVAKIVLNFVDNLWAMLWILATSFSISPILCSVSRKIRRRTMEAEEKLALNKFVIRS